MKVAGIPSQRTSDRRLAECSVKGLRLFTCVVDKSSRFQTRSLRAGRPATRTRRGKLDKLFLFRFECFCSEKHAATEVRFQNGSMIPSMPACCFLKVVRGLLRPCRRRTARAYGVHKVQYGADGQTTHSHGRVGNVASCKYRRGRTEEQARDQRSTSKGPPKGQRRINEGRDMQSAICSGFGLSALDVYVLYSCCAVQFLGTVAW